MLFKEKLSNKIMIMLVAVGFATGISCRQVPGSHTVPIDETQTIVNVSKSFLFNLFIINDTLCSFQPNESDLTAFYNYRTGKVAGIIQLDTNFTKKAYDIIRSHLDTSYRFFNLKEFREWEGTYPNIIFRSGHCKNHRSLYYMVDVVYDYRNKLSSAGIYRRFKDTYHLSENTEITLQDAWRFLLEVDIKTLKIKNIYSIKGFLTYRNGQWLLTDNPEVRDTSEILSFSNNFSCQDSYLITQLFWTKNFIHASNYDGAKYFLAKLYYKEHKMSFVEKIWFPKSALGNYFLNVKYCRNDHGEVYFYNGLGKIYRINDAKILFDTDVGAYKVHNFCVSPDEKNINFVFLKNKKFSFAQYLVVDKQLKTIYIPKKGKILEAAVYKNKILSIIQKDESIYFYEYFLKSD